MNAAKVVLKRGREKPVQNQHPWIFSGAIKHVENAAPGDIVTVVNEESKFLARGYFNPSSQIQVRILTWQDEAIDENWWGVMLERSINGRSTKNKQSKTVPIAYRVVNAENDFLPGLIVDRYGDYLVLQALTLYIDQHKQMLTNMLVDLFIQQEINILGVYERSDVSVRKKEGLPASEGIIWGDNPPERLEIVAPVQHFVDIYNGHKTGHYLDQQSNLEVIAKLSDDRPRETEFRVLNLFSYTGTFGIKALESPNTHVTNVDSSLEALTLAEKNLELNNFTSDKYELVQADGFEYLRYCVDEGTLFDLIILDPPKFAHTKQQVNRAARGYKDLNLNAFKIIETGGHLMTFSCSGAISRDLFQKIVFGALADSGRQAQIIQHLQAAPDHPVALSFPEGEYLKGLLLRVY